MSSTQRSSLKRLACTRGGVPQVVAYVRDNGDGSVAMDLAEVEGLAAVVEDVYYHIGDKRRTVEFRDARLLVYWVDKDGMPHRDDDLPAVVGDGNTFSWYRHGINYRPGGLPCLISAGVFTWNCGEECGCFHRLDGLPAQIATSETYGTQMIWGIHGGGQYDDDPRDDPDSKYWEDAVIYRRTHSRHIKGIASAAASTATPT